MASSRPRSRRDRRGAGGGASSRPPRALARQVLFEEAVGVERGACVSSWRSAPPTLSSSGSKSGDRGVPSTKATGRATGCAWCGRRASGCRRGRRRRPFGVGAIDQSVSNVRGDVAVRERELDVCVDSVEQLELGDGGEHQPELADVSLEVLRGLRDRGAQNRAPDRSGCCDRAQGTASAARAGCDDKVVSAAATASIDRTFKRVLLGSPERQRRGQHRNQTPALFRRCRRTAECARVEEQLDFAPWERRGALYEGIAVVDVRPPCRA